MATASTKGLTWFSLGLGIAQVVAPGKLAKLIGLRDTADTRSLMRLMGVREATAGLGLLSGTRTATWLGGRLGGDLIDIALLVGALRGRRVKRGRLLAALVSVLGVTALDVRAAMQAGKDGGRPHSPTSSGRATPTTKTIVVNRAPEDVYQFWLNFENFPRFMRHLDAVRDLGDGRSHWKAVGPAGAMFEWDAQVGETRPNELITWRSLPGADVDNAGSVRFERAPGGRGTLVRVNLRYDPPAGALGKAVATLFGREPGQEVQEDLRRFKQVMETGEVMRSDASFHQKPHPARPPEQAPPLQPPYEAGVPTRSRVVRESWDRPDDRSAPAGGGRSTTAPASEESGATLARGGAR